jgi:uncharacterized cofD-like protein
VNLVAIGGGTGLATLLRGVKQYVVAGRPWQIGQLSAIVTVTDEGGSSGVLRKELSMLPPGDVRNCIVALAEEEQLLSRLFNYRFEGDSALKGHSLGNLLIAALTDIMGGFDQAILAASEVLAIRGSIYPSTLSLVTLRAICEDGSVVLGETAISGDGASRSDRAGHSRIRRLELDPAGAEPVPEAIEAIENAEMIVIGPGSLYTSVLPNLLIRRIADALRSTSAVRVYVCNVMTQPGETDGYAAEDHLRAILDHAGTVVDWIVVNDCKPSRSTLDAYAAQRQFPVAFDLDKLREMGVAAFPGRIISEGNYLRHDGDALADALGRLWAHERALHSA